MAQLVIDIGNTLIKVAVFNGNELVSVEKRAEINEDYLSELISSAGITKAVISSVRAYNFSWLGTLEQQVTVTHFDRNMAFNIINHYRTPQTLGLDRLAGIMGARYLYPDNYNLVIDAGTCITYDGVDTTGNYYGGSISPGLKMRYKALNSFTSGLPLAEADQAFKDAYGNDTTTAIRSGVQNGIRYELFGFIQQYSNNTNGINIILTGGDSLFLDTLLKNSIFAGYIKTEPYLVLRGLNAAIQEHND